VKETFTIIIGYNLGKCYSRGYGGDERSEYPPPNTFSPEYKQYRNPSLSANDVYSSFMNEPDVGNVPLTNRKRAVSEGSVKRFRITKIN
jgi:hypothetical protein